MVFYILVFIYTERLNELCKEEYLRLSDIEDVSAIIVEHHA